ncbi:DHH family phosphoesterase [Ulvibacter antarcticus]|uniref:Phosphoesterase RecJ-like protein n=1 Tax=Ulvibacter antarcticus TaxID=442714 RepID=A0A3L9YCZ4_9FLAO|nr:bifunctional oligoribonuclease/PAP phosphatase NrnA [Ulvibacter antarcticus]RMA58603.1 phosphoesterase RecJ-like protein [Ulvibacter antarcticus]
MNSETTSTIKKLLETSKKIVIVGHRNPDGDALGSSLGLYFFLKHLGHHVSVVMPNEFPDFLKWMPGSDAVLIYEKEIEKTTAVINEATVIFVLDFNSLGRVGDLKKPLEESEADFIMIDHHQQPDEFAVATYSDTNMSSTAEMVYHCIAALDGTETITADIATNLYAGIMTDTGSFRFPSTSAETHRVIANLIDKGANNALIHQNIFDTNSPDRMRLLGVALKNLHILPEYNTAYITLSQEELDANNFKKGDTEGFVNYALSVEGVVFAIIFIENKQDSIIKMSLRSKGDFSVNEFSRAHYHGGGHTNAAGGRSSHSLNNTITEFISILPDYKNALTRNDS